MKQICRRSLAALLAVLLLYGVLAPGALAVSPAQVQRPLAKAKEFDLIRYAVTGFAKSK